MSRAHTDAAGSGMDPMDVLRAELEKMLGAAGINQRLPFHVVERASVDASYLYRLAAVSSAAELEKLIEGTGKTLPKWAPQPSWQLAARALAAFGRWSLAGFAPVDASTLKRRRENCLSCPHLDADKTPRAAIFRTTEACGLCGCAIDRKVAIPTEDCPAPDPANPHLSRWGEPMQRKLPLPTFPSEDRAG